MTELLIFISTFDVCMYLLVVNMRSAAIVFVIILYYDYSSLHFTTF